MPEPSPAHQPPNGTHLLPPCTHMCSTTADYVLTRMASIAVAIEAKTKQDSGIIALYRSDTLALLGTYTAGALPDMVTLSEDGRYVVAANEGEPSGDYKTDPEGSVTIIDLDEGFSAEQAVVKQVSFVDFNTGGSRAAEFVSSGVRLGRTVGSVAQNLEPEYLALNAGGSKAFVALQENNALAIVDIATARVDSIKSLGEKSWASNQLDASNKDGEVGKFQSYDQLVGLYMPDTITSFEKDGKTYIVSANEGDGREYGYDSTQEACENASHIWDGDDYSPGGDDEDATKFTTEEDTCISFIDEARGGDLFDDATISDANPLKTALDSNDELKRLKFMTDDLTIEAGDTLKSYGARSFSIWNADGTLVYDSGDDIAKQVYATDADNFNATNDVNATSETADNRSDDKGVEPEAVEVASINDRLFAFVGLERQGGVIVYDITDPVAPVYQSYLNNRDFTEGVCTELDDDSECDNKTYNTAAGDLGPESIEYFSRLSKHYIAVGNEVSGTTTVYNVTFE